MAEKYNEQVGVETPVETTDRGLFEFKNKDEEGKPIKEETLASEFDQKFLDSDRVEAEYKDAEENQQYHRTPVEAEYKDAEENQQYRATPVEAEYKDAEEKQQYGGTAVEDTTDHSLFDLIKNDSENKKPVTEETFATEFDQKARVKEPVEYKDEDVKEHGTVVQMPRSYSSSDNEGDDKETRQRKKEKKEKKGLTEKLMEKLPGHKDKVEEENHVPLEQPHVQEPVYSEPPHYQEEDPEKKSFLNKIKEKLPGGHTKTDDYHDEAVPVSVEPSHVEGEDKKGFMDKIKDKIPGLSSSKASDEKNDHDEKVISI